MAAPKTNPSFEELYKQLEETVNRLEQGGLSLDDSLASYESAVALAQQCQQLLEQAELRITRLRESFAVSEDREEYDADVEPDD
ncbi:MAG TPA: exodeoxyribonuclease VII small subunit [Dehalococcoidia bacterium]